MALLRRISKLERPVFFGSCHDMLDRGERHVTLQSSELISFDSAHGTISYLIYLRALPVGHAEAEDF